MRTQAMIGFIVISLLTGCQRGQTPEDNILIPSESRLTSAAEDKCKGHYLVGYDVKESASG